MSSHRGDKRSSHEGDMVSTADSIIHRASLLGASYDTHRYNRLSNETELGEMSLSTERIHTHRRDVGLRPIIIEDPNEAEMRYQPTVEKRERRHRRSHEHNRHSLQRNQSKEEGLRNIVVYEEIGNVQDTSYTPLQEEKRHKKRKKKEKKTQPLPEPEPESDPEEGRILVSVEDDTKFVESKKSEADLKPLNPQYPSMYPTDVEKVIRMVTVNVRDNSRVLRYLGDMDDGFSTRRRSDKVPVEVRVNFLRIVEVDTKEQCFSAEVLVQAKWTEPRLAGRSQQELDNIDWTKWWQPEIILTNLEGEPDEDYIWITSHASVFGYRFPVVYHRRRIRATFTEKLELKNFPVDTQELTLSLSSERSVKEIDLQEDKYWPSSVDTENFSDILSWNLYKHVEVSQSTQASTAEEQAANGKPTMTFTCHVSRKCGFFLWNILLVMFLLTSLSFCAFSVDAKKTAGRLGVTLILLLTAIAFKLVVNTTLPIITYLTHLDIYMMAGVVFLSLQAVQNAVAGAFANGGDTDTAEQVDEWSVVALVIFTLLFHIIFILVLAIKTYRSRSRLSEKDEQYERHTSDHEKTRSTQIHIGNNNSVKPAQSLSLNSKYHTKRDGHYWDMAKTSPPVLVDNHETTNA